MLNARMRDEKGYFIKMKEIIFIEYKRNNVRKGDQVYYATIQREMLMKQVLVVSWRREL